MPVQQDWVRTVVIKRSMCCGQAQEIVAHQSIRADSGHQIFLSFPVPHSWSQGPDHHRQYDHPVLYQQTGWHPFFTSSISSDPAVGMVLQSPHFSSCSSHGLFKL